MGPRNKQFLTSISPLLYEKKITTKVYTVGTNQKSQIMKKKVAEMAKIKQNP